MSATYRRRNQLIARLALCAGGGLIVGGVVAVPFSGHDSTTVVGSDTTATAFAEPTNTAAIGAPVSIPTSSPTSTSTNGAGVSGTSTLSTNASTPPAPPTTGPATSTATIDPPTTTGATTPTAATTTVDTPGPGATVPDVAAAAYVLIDADTGQTMAASNASERHPVGSMMKLLTAYVVMQAGDPTKVVTVPPLDLAEGESRIYLSPGQHFQRDLLMRAMLIVSAGDAAEALAVDVAGSQDAFVEQMNAAAKELRMNDTNAANADGLDADDGYSTASDIASLARVLMQDPTFRSTVARTSAQLFGKAFPSTNTLLSSYAGATGIKTGHTTDAGYCLTASATRNGHSLIAVVIGTPTKQARDDAAAAVLDWGFAHLGE
ncbi:MAG: D-alanyl-D-alanine carboxypeptidase [Ilumatobacteraceae bacterium]|nr:D-alanyl-D-alanine carboxypeptidase [Ilumatobacteraceae bacterium]